MYNVYIYNIYEKNTYIAGLRLGKNGINIDLSRGLKKDEGRKHLGAFKELLIILRFLYLLP